MKAWLGNVVYTVTAEQLAEINRIAEEVYQKTGDRSKGLEEAIRFAKKSNFPVAKKVNVMPAQPGELLVEDPEKAQELFDRMFDEKMKNLKK